MQVETTQKEIEERREKREERRKKRTNPCIQESTR